MAANNLAHKVYNFANHIGLITDEGRTEITNNGKVYYEQDAIEYKSFIEE